MGFHNEISSSPHRMLQSSSYCSCGTDKHAGFFHCRGSCLLIGPYMYMHACCHWRLASADTWKGSDIINGDVASCSASGASSFCCACCQASPAALVASPSPVVPLSNWNHPILTCIHGDTNFQKLTYSYPCFSIFRENSKLVRRSKCEVDLKESTIGNTVHNHGLYLA